MRLSRNTLSQLPKTVVIPSYDREKIIPRIVHLGFGAFHKAHQAVYADILASDFGSDWGYCVVKSQMGGEQQTEDLKAQDHLYSVSENSDDNLSTRVIGITKEALHVQTDGLEKVIEAMLRPQIAIVSITITEKGYYYLPSTASIDKNDPFIRHDIENPQTPKTTPGLIVEVLRRRKELGVPAFTVMSCDNIPKNGNITRNVVLALAKEQDKELATWIEKNVTFPSTMVDRIVPAVTPSAMEKIAEQLGGIEDTAGVIGESFRQWVIEDNFVTGRPQWEKVGVELVDNVLPYEKMKLRMLNGSHSFLSYLGYLAGYQYIDECMQDANFVAVAYHLILEEQAPTLQIQGVNLEAYTESLLSRYRNTGLKHRTWQIAMDGTLKLPQRMLDSIKFHLDSDTAFDCLALGVAGWMRYVSGKDDAGNAIDVSDPAISQIKELVANSGDGKKRVKALLSLSHVFGEDLPKNMVFVETVESYYLSLKEKGAKKTVQNLSEKLLITI